MTSEMIYHPNRRCTLPIFAIISLLAHLFVVYLLGLLNPFEPSMPLNPLSTVTVTLDGCDSAPLLPAAKGEIGSNGGDSRPARHIAHTGTGDLDSAKTVTALREPSSSAKEVPPVLEALPLSALPLATVEAKASDIPEEAVKDADDSVALPLSPADELHNGPVREAGEFLAAKLERLTYRISLLKVPVGSAVMEATNKDGELRITVKITSNAVLSSLYPVDDLVETRLIKGNYLLTRVRQKEGSFRGDFGFTLMLREHKAFWVDRLRNRYDYQPIPGDDVMDLLSGFYFLRSLDLEVGKEVQLQLFDSNEYSPTNVEVLRRERIELPGSRAVETLALHPLFKTAGFFRRTGDIMIWLTDDRFRVPVRMETSIALGKVTAELVSAESEQE
jgi:hypothetical protein